MIRDATIDDLQELVDMLHDLHNESDYSRWAFDEEIMTADIAPYISRNDGACFIGNGGFIAGRLFKYPSSNTTACAEQYWYVKPEHRGGSLGIKLYRKLEAWALDRGCEDLVFEIGTGIDMEKVGNLLLKLGHRHVGGVYKKEM